MAMKPTADHQPTSAQSKPAQLPSTGEDFGAGTNGDVPAWRAGAFLCPETPREGQDGLKLPSSSTSSSSSSSSSPGFVVSRDTPGAGVRPWGQRHRDTARGLPVGRTPWDWACCSSLI